ncbi:hypothetical protein Aph01nite_53560 [Acrocarpospora phusangensis]|uniref:Uncharacterized protein n=1 Tax=Acrocarpospora phusangensis TaxID=1070424 RepID=A0A919UM81_9ACTN|nr:hypothetical protein [Acrocarpospora phusangensis]GIH27046.1 hypothetical protein Aph01nite_53560 [Acrocarpospora phusangensis]
MDDGRVWPPADRGEPDQDLPPSARWYGTPTAPPRRLPRWAATLLISVLALLTAGAVVTVAALAVLGGPDEPAETVAVSDGLAGVTYPLPPGWRQGVLAPVTGFTTVATNQDLAIVMIRPGDEVEPSGLRAELVELTELYSRLLLHGDKVDVVKDEAITVNGRAGHTRALHAEYRDVVNRPAYLRVTLLTTSSGGSVVILGLAHPDTPQSRADLDLITSGVR